MTFQLEDRQGSLAKVCQALGDRGVNIVAFQPVISEGKERVRCAVDNPTSAKKVLKNEGLGYSETAVAQARLRHRPGESARAAARLGEANINVRHVYCGVGASANTPVIFGAKEVQQAAAILNRTAAAA
ncbi:MAG TPA: hypothetical protein VE083_08725 [Terriglobales bacterium]|nr:hypothetical protein [Terriglobales bacterium]